MNKDWIIQGNVMWLNHLRIEISAHESKVEYRAYSRSMYIGKSDQLNELIECVESMNELKRK